MPCRQIELRAVVTFLYMLTIHFIRNACTPADSCACLISQHVAAAQKNLIVLIRRQIEEKRLISAIFCHVVLNSRQGGGNILENAHRLGIPHTTVPGKKGKWSDWLDVPGRTQ